MEEISNRVSASSLVLLDFDDYIDKSERVLFDLKDTLFQQMILRERDFREFIQNHDWSQYQGKHVGVVCSVDAIVPSWAYMMVASQLGPVALSVSFGDDEAIEKSLIDKAIEEILKKDLQNAKVVIKGCGGIKGRDYAYFQLSKQLTPIVSSMMYGEPCSTVPVFKKKKA